MALFIRSKRDYWTRLPLTILVIAILAFTPLLVGVAGGWVNEALTNTPCDEGNCSWAVIPWFTFYSAPLGLLLLLILFIITAIDSVNILKSANK